MFSLFSGEDHSSEDSSSGTAYFPLSSGPDHSSEDSSIGASGLGNPGGRAEVDGLFSSNSSSVSNSTSDSQSGIKFLRKLLKTSPGLFD